MSAQSDADASKALASNRRDDAEGLKVSAGGAIAGCSGMTIRLGTVTQTQLDAMVSRGGQTLLDQYNALVATFNQKKNALTTGDSVATSYLNGGKTGMNAGDALYQLGYYGMAKSDYDQSYDMFNNACITWGNVIAPANAATAALEAFMNDNILGTP